MATGAPVTDPAPGCVSGAGEPELDVFRLGTVRYQAALALQEDRRDRILAGDAGPALFLLEHPPTVTLGPLCSDDDLLVSRDRLTQQGIEVHGTNRGGRATYHGPGQLVGYPVLDLTSLPGAAGAAGPSVRAYLRGLEEVILRIMRRTGIHGRRLDGAAGVWVGDRKVASVGVAVRRWVTTHGFALNVRTDLSAFQWIRPCGFSPDVMTSMERESGAVPDPQQLEGMVVEEFSAVFGMQYRFVSPRVGDEAR